MNIIGANVVTRLGIPTRLTWLHTGSQHSWGSPFGQLTACHCCPTACLCRWSPVLFEMLALCSSCRSRAISWKQGCKVVVIVLKEVHINKKNFHTKNCEFFQKNIAGFFLPHQKFMGKSIFHIISFVTLYLL